jgi:transcription antitermination factor NusG
MPAETKLGGCKHQNSESNWYAVYICSRQEKPVAEQIERRRVSCFLPRYRSVRRWKDWRKELDLVLFPGSVLVQMKREDRSQVLQLPGVVRVVSFDGRPAALPVGEMERLRERLSRSSKVAPHPYLGRGRRVRVPNRPLQGLEGTIVRRKESCRHVFSSDVIQRSVASRWTSPI